MKRSIGFHLPQGTPVLDKFYRSFVVEFLLLITGFFFIKAGNLCSKFSDCLVSVGLFFAEPVLFLNDREKPLPQNIGNNSIFNERNGATDDLRNHSDSP